MTMPSVILMMPMMLIIILIMVDYDGLDTFYVWVRKIYSNTKFSIRWQQCWWQWKRMMTCCVWVWEIGLDARTLVLVSTPRRRCCPPASNSLEKNPLMSWSVSHLIWFQPVCGGCLWQGRGGERSRGWSGPTWHPIRIETSELIKYVLFHVQTNYNS